MSILKPVCIILTALSAACIPSTLGAWSLADLLKIPYNSQHKTLGTAVGGNTFDPRQDIRYLPQTDYRDIFKSIRDLSISRDPDVRKYIFLYLTLGRDYVKKAIERYHIYSDILDEIYSRNRDIPREIMLLPLLESGFNPFAVSRSKATGLWQFLLNTSRPLGLVDNRWIDERRDIEKSTDAALRHLRYLNDKFNSWELALTAYNGGKGLVERGIKNSGAENVWDLRESGELTNEASQFFPRFIALVLIFNNQKLYGIDKEVIIPGKAVTEKILIQYPVSLHHVSKFSGTPMNTIRRYNPELIRDTTPPVVSGYSLRLPREGKEMLEKNIGQLYKYKLKNIRTHVVKNGETLTQIGAKYKIKSHELLIFNSLKNPNLLKPGQIINIPN